MTKTYTTLGVSIVLLFMFFAVTVHADTRGTSRGDRTSPAVTPPPASPPPAAPVAPPKNNGGISNTTTVEVESGGNTGGKVTTGDEKTELKVVNQGPTNSNTVVTNKPPAPPPVPEPTCEPTRTTRCETDSRER